MTTDITPVSLNVNEAGAAPAPAPAPAAPAPAPAAPAPAPAAPAPAHAAPAPAPAPAPAASGDGKLEETGDPALDIAISFINDAGIKANDPAVEAARDGDFTLLEARLATMGAKGYERIIALAKAAYERHTAAEGEHNATVKSIVHAECGGEAGWAAVSAWASKEGTAAEKAQINAAFAAGGVQARAAAQYLARAYEKAGRPGYQEPKPAIKLEAGAGGEGATAPLTAKAYAAAVQQLHGAARGRDISNTPEYRELQSRRRAARAAGY